MLSAMNYRPHRLAQALKTEISAILSRELQDPRIGFTTVTEVRVSRDLRHARVYVSVFDSAEKQRETMTTLKSAVPWIRQTLFSRLRLRHSPEIVFSLDESVAHGDQMSRLLDEVRRELPPLPPLEAGSDPVPEIAPDNHNQSTDPEKAAPENRTAAQQDEHRPGASG